MFQSKIWHIAATFLIFFNVSAQNPGDKLFNYESIHRIEISFYEGDWEDSLRYYHEQGLEKYMMCDIKINYQSLPYSGIRIKGTGSYYNIIDYTDKVSFKIDLNLYVPDQNYDGLIKLNLNNGYNDPTFMREKLFLDYLNKQGLKAPRCTYANVYINNEHFGFYILVEQVDRVFLSSAFGNSIGNLYKASKGAGLQWEGYLTSDYTDFYILQSSQNYTNWDDLVDLCYTINSASDTDFIDKLEQKLNTDFYIRTWAANNLFVNLDSYEYAAENFYIYNNSFDNKFNWISWDGGNAFGAGSWNLSTLQKQNLSFNYMPDPPPSPLNDTVPLTDRMLKSTYYSTQYKDAICEFLQTDFTTMYLYDQIDTIYSKIKPHVSADDEKLYSDQQFENNINYAVSIDTAKELPGLKSLIQQRIINVAAEIGCLVNIPEIKPEKVLQVIFNPNPVISNAWINIRAQSDFNCNRTCSLTIYDLLGREMSNIYIPDTNNKYYFEANHFPKGIFFYKLISNRDVLFKGKLIVQ